MQKLGFSNKWFECEITQSSPAFPGGLPPLKPHLIKMQPEGYIGKKVLDLRARYERPFIDLITKLDEHKVKSSKLISLYDDMMTEYDREVLSTTCALGLWKGAHTDLDSTGGPGGFNDFELPPNVKEAVAKYYNKIKEISPDKISTSMVRGKNVGWPHPISGMQRELNLALYAVHAQLAQDSYSGKRSLQQTILDLERYHGPSYAIYGERSQHTAKPQPMIMKEGFFYSTNFEARKRGILMVPKFVVMHNRIGVQHAKHKILRSTVHNQHRPDLVKDIGTAMKQYTVKAVDWPKFDYTFGGKAGRSVLDIIANISDGKLSKDDLLKEFEMPLLYFGHKGAFLDPTAPQLPSGASFTSLMGCVANFSTLVWAISTIKEITPEAVIQALDDKWFLRCWGDDTVVGLDTSWLTHEKLFSRLNDIIKKEMDVESVIKYLGDVYAGDTIKQVSVGYQLSRWIQQQDYPERDKDFPFTTIGYIARLEKLNPSIQQEAHKRRFSLWDEKKMGPYFPFTEKERIMQDAVKNIEKYASRISQIDDILQFMTHGNEESFFDSDDEYQNDFVKQLLGVVSVDISDPQGMIKDHAKYRSLRFALDRFASMGFPAYGDILNALRTDFNLKYKKGDLVY